MVSGRYERHQNHFVQLQELKVLKYASIYGPNACGKTNFISALRKLSEIVTEGTRDKKELLPYFPFKLDPDKEKEPTSFEIDFLEDNEIYSYFIKFNESIIFEEWLYIIKGDSNEMIYERITEINTLKNSLKINKTLFPIEEYDLRIQIYEKNLRSNQPFIFDGNNMNLKYIKESYNWFNKKLHILSPELAVKGLVTSLVRNKEFNNLFNKFITEVGLGLDKFSIKEKDLNEYFINDSESKEKKNIESILRIEDSYDFRTDSGKFLGAYKDNNDLIKIGELELLHLNNLNKYIDLGLYAESRGTIRLISLLYSFINISLKDYVLVMDELETSIHPLLIDYLLKKFIFENNKDSSGQLIFSTHMTNLLDLDLLRQDEIWFFDKNRDNKTVITPLSEFQVRFDLDIQKRYLEGKFGAIPCLKHLTTK
jgi:AAA15 family ATPase/GTPase